jgi:hypothetical protein
MEGNDAVEDVNLVVQRDLDLQPCVVVAQTTIAEVGLAGEPQHDDAAWRRRDRSGDRAVEEKV